MNVTDYICERARSVNRVPEYQTHIPGFTMFNDGGVENEVGEFLHSLVRIVKPDNVLETGVHKGISSSYMALAMKQNNRGRLAAVDLDLHPEADLLWKELGVWDAITFTRGKSLVFEPQTTFQIALLDTEPDIRFDEFAKFWPFIEPGGFIIIHDLNPHLGFSGLLNHGMMHWPFGDFRPKLGPAILAHDVQTFSFPTPRGLTIFQKIKEGFSANALLLGKI